MWTRALSLGGVARRLAAERELQAATSSQDLGFYTIITNFIVHDTTSTLKSSKLIYNQSFPQTDRVLDGPQRRWVLLYRIQTAAQTRIRLSTSLFHSSTRRPECSRIAVYSGLGTLHGPRAT